MRRSTTLAAAARVCGRAKADCTQLFGNGTAMVQTVVAPVNLVVSPPTIVTTLSICNTNQSPAASVTVENEGQTTTQYLLISGQCIVASGSTITLAKGDLPNSPPPAKINYCVEAVSVVPASRKP